MYGLKLVVMLVYAAGGPVHDDQHPRRDGEYERGLTTWLDSVGAGSCAPVRRMHR